MRTTWIHSRANRTVTHAPSWNPTTVVGGAGPRTVLARGLVLPRLTGFSCSTRNVAYMITVVKPEDLLREERRRAGLSIRALGKVAGVSPSTISRIESGRMDPTVGMLSRLLESAGLELELTTHDPTTPRLASLGDAWKSSARGDLVDWTRLRAFLDHVALNGKHTASAIRTAPPPSGSKLLDNLLAGIAETLADEAGLSRPAWTSRIPAMREGWSTPGTARVQEAARRTTPPAIAARGLTLARTSLWRDRALVR